MAITELDIGGAEQAFVRIAKGLKGLGWDVDVISLRNAGPLSDPLRAAGIPVSALQVGRFSDFRAIGRMQKLLRTRQPSVLLTFLHQANIVGRIAGRLARVPRIVSGIRVADRRWSVMIPERLTSGLVDHYVAVSKSVADVHRRLCGIPSERISAIPNGVDFETIGQLPAADRAEWQMDSEARIILSVGRLCEQKAPLDVLEAFRKLRNQTEDGLRLKLFFVGDGPLRPRIERQIAAMNLGNDVRLLGWRPDVVQLMKASDVLVLASRWEGLPNVILEAQAAGLPVVASSVDGCRELITDGVTGRLFCPGDAADLVSVLGDLLASPPEAASLAEKAGFAVKSRYRWETCIEAFHKLLTDLTAANTP